MSGAPQALRSRSSVLAARAAADPSDPRAGSGPLAALLPRERPARWAHFLLRVLLFKLYWQSGLAKWQSPIGGWQDGSAMGFYYETAPLPARWAHAAHALPAAWHRLESWFTLGFELLLPFAIFGTPSTSGRSWTATSSRARAGGGRGRGWARRGRSDAGSAGGREAQK